MLGYLRERSGSWIIKIILGFIIVIFAFFFGVGGFGPKSQGPVAMVNDQAISFEEYKQSYESLIQQKRSKAGDNYDAARDTANVKQDALNRLINEKLVLEAAETFGFKVSNKELADLLNEYTIFKENGKFDFNTYKRVLAANSMTPETFESIQRKSLKQRKVQDIILDMATITDMEALQWHKFLNTKVSIDYLKLDPDDFDNINPGPGEIEKFYNENKENYKTDERVVVQYLRFSGEDYKDKIKVTENELIQYYEENADKYNIEAKVEARHILIRTDQTMDKDKIEEKRKQALKIYEMAIAEDSKFEEIAKKYSEGPSSSNGGYLGQFAKDDMVASFSKKAFSMEPGEISKPVKTKFGWHIIKVINKIKPAKKSFADVKEKIRENILKKKIADLAYYDAGDAFDAVIDGDTLEQAGLLTRRKLITEGPFTASGQGLSIKDNGNFVKAAFSTRINEISNIVEIEDSYYLIRPVKKIKPEIIEFEVVQDRVKTELIAKIKKDKTEKLSKSILAQVKDKKKLSKIAGDNNLKLYTTRLFSRYGFIPELGYAPDITKASFQLKEKGASYSDALKMNNLYFIISLHERVVPKGFKDAAGEKAVKTDLLNRKKELIYRAWINNLKTVNDIKILRPEFFEEKV